MDTIYLNSPEGNAFYIIGKCLQVLECLFPDAEERAVVVADFCERAAGSQYKSLLALVKEVSKGEIVFNETDTPSEHTMNLRADEIEQTQISGMLAMTQPNERSIR